MGRTEPISILIFGETASKANSRRLIFRGRKPAFIKSKKALSYVDMFRDQCPSLDDLFTCDLHLDLDIWYASRRPDLDESLILDALQGLVYENDRQVRSRRTRWGLDRLNPRTLITIRPLAEGDTV